MVSIAPSILSADFADLAAAIEAVSPAADLLHVDVMDGHFVPNLTIGPPVVKSIRRRTALRLDCHLMVTNPGEHLEAFRAAGADSCSVHVELGDPTALVAQGRDLGLGIGLAVNPDTPLTAYERWIELFDMILIMTVFPGFGGQAFMPEVVEKIAATRAAIDRAGLDTVIEVDGGIDETTAPVVVGAGASILVAGSAIFGAEDGPVAAAGRIRRAAEAA